jgi:uncharacterized protein YjiS (DUF1127 family)
MIDTRKSPATLFRPASGGVTRMVSRVVQTWFARRSARARLAALDPHLLRDIGLSEDQARREAVKHFWIE